MDQSDRKKLILRYYDDYARNYGYEYYTTIAGRYFLKKKLKIALRLAHFRRGDFILDAGCANGPFAFALAHQGFRVIGTDISKKNIAECKRRAKKFKIPSLQFYVADLENLRRFRQNQFDGIISFATIRYVPNVPIALKELYRVLKPRGVAIVDFPNKYSPWFLIFQHFAWKYVLPKDKECDLHYSAKQALSFMRNAGFKDLAVTVDFWIPRTAPNWLAPLMIVLDIVMSHIPLVRNLGGAIVIRGKK